MRTLILALFLAVAGLNHAAGMDGFDLGDMPPLPPPLLDDSPAAPPLAPPGTGSLSPLVQGGNTSTAGLTPMAPPPGLAPSAPPVAADVGGMDFASPAPPLAPPAAASLAPPAPAGLGAVALPAQAGGQGMVQTLPASAAPSIPETPRPARIEGGRVNVRAGPNTQYESIAVLTTGSPITVLAKHGDWYKIVFPADQLASIHKSLVSADITGEIPEAGLPGVVNQDNANVHAFYWDKSTVVGTLARGAPVIIKQERGQWYRIVAPDTARAYVFGTYVRIDGGQEVAADTAPAPVNPAVDLTATDGEGGSRPVKLSKDQERVLEIKESYYKRLRERFEAEQEAEEAEAKAAAEARKLQANQLDSALKDLESRLVAIDQERDQRIDYVVREFMPPQQTMISGFGAAEWMPPDPATGGYTGWVENIGRVGGAPTPHRLTKGGEIRFYLVSNQFNLDEFTNRRVWVNGQMEYAGGASASVLVVDQIRILTELEIADGMMRQQQAGGYAPPAGDPYAGQQYGAQPYGGGYDMGAVTEYGPTGQPLAPAGGQQAQTYVAQPTYAAPAGGDPFAGYGSDYGQQTYGQPYADAGMYAASPAPGAPDMMATPGQIFTAPPGEEIVYGGAFDPGMGQGGAPAASGTFPSAPAGGGMQPSDPSQLPDVVGAGTQYSVPMDVGGGMSVGEVDTDRYERPIVNEIAP